ncbi:hypothetical protein JD844_003896, partial [Phrynosoma platyrhinos]
MSLEAGAGAEGPEGAPGEALVEVRLGERSFAVSKRKLLEQSDFFGALYRSGMREAEAEAEAKEGGPVEVQRLRGGLSAEGLELVLDFIRTSRLEEPREEDGEDGEPWLLEALVEAASFLQVTPLLRRLRSRLRLPNCLRLHRLAQVYGLRELQEAALDFMAARFHQVLRRPEARPPLLLLPAALRQQLRERRMRGPPALVALGSFPQGEAQAPASGSMMLRYEEGSRRWVPLPAALPPELGGVRGSGAAVLDNYLFLAGGLRLTSHE